MVQRHIGHQASFAYGNSLFLMRHDFGRDGCITGGPAQRMDLLAGAVYSAYEEVRAAIEYDVAVVNLRSRLRRREGRALQSDPALWVGQWSMGYTRHGSNCGRLAGLKWA